MVLNGTSCNSLPDAGPDLDNKYPYPPVIGTNEFGDSPAVQLLPADNEVSRTFNAQTYLLWSSGLTNSIPVPIGSIMWNFTGMATNSGTSTTQKWKAKGSKNVGSFVPSDISQASYGYPTWSNFITNGKCYATN